MRCRESGPSSNPCSITYLLCDTGQMTSPSELSPPELQNGDNTCWRLDFQCFCFLTRPTYYTLAFGSSVLRATHTLLYISGQKNMSWGTVMFQPAGRRYSFNSIASISVPLNILLQFFLLYYKMCGKWKVLMLVINKYKLFSAVSVIKLSSLSFKPTRLYSALRCRDWDSANNILPWPAAFF